MYIRKILDSYEIHEGIIKTRYQLSGPVTSEVLSLLSQDEPVFTGYQYLSPTYSIYKSNKIVISGIIKSPILEVTCPNGCHSYTSEYLDALLSTIPDKNSLISKFQQIKIWLCSKISKIRSKNEKDEQENIEGVLIVD
jgi:hypothetical protein